MGVAAPLRRVGTPQAGRREGGRETTEVVGEAQDVLPGVLLPVEVGPPLATLGEVGVVPRVTPWKGVRVSGKDRPRAVV